MNNNCNNNAQSPAFKEGVTFYHNFTCKEENAGVNSFSKNPYVMNSDMTSWLDWGDGLRSEILRLEGEAGYHKRMGYEPVAKLAREEEDRCYEEGVMAYKTYAETGIQPDNPCDANNDVRHEHWNIGFFDSLNEANDNFVVLGKPREIVDVGSTFDMIFRSQ